MASPSAALSPRSWGSMDGLVEVGDSGVVVASLRGIPDKLPHQCRRLGLGLVQFTPNVASPRVRDEKGDLPQVLPGIRDQRRGRCAVISLVETAYLFAEIGHAHQVSAARVRENVAQPLPRRQLSR